MVFNHAGVFSLRTRIGVDIGISILERGYGGILNSTKDFNIVDILLMDLEKKHPGISKSEIYGTLKNIISTYAIETTFCPYKSDREPCILRVRITQDAVLYLRTRLFNEYIKDNPGAVALFAKAKKEYLYEVTNRLYPFFSKYHSEVSKLPNDNRFKAFI